MTHHQRNITGLLTAAKEKRRSALARVTKLINDLENTNQPISFSYISKESGVSKAWIYRQKDISDRINELRLKIAPQVKRLSPPTEIKSSIVRALKDRIKKLEAENSALRKQLEVLYGKLYIKSEV